MMNLFGTKENSMKTKLSYLSGILIFGINIGCAGEGLSGNKDHQESKSMNATSQGYDGDSGTIDSQYSGRKVLDLSIDVGATTLSFVPLDRDFKVSWKKGASCERIEVRENSSGLEVKHLDRDGSCGESKIELLVNEKLSTRFNGGTGFLSVSNLGKFMSYADEINAVVMAGQIDAYVDGLEVERKWSQMSAYYHNNKNSGISLKIAMGAGSVALRR
jgi:hypothetical protein